MTASIFDCKRSFKFLQLAHASNVIRELKVSYFLLLLVASGESRSVELLDSRLLLADFLFVVREEDCSMFFVVEVFFSLTDVTVSIEDVVAFHDLAELFHQGFIIHVLVLVQISAGAFELVD